MTTIKQLLSSMIEKINEKVKTVNGVAPDENGNVAIEVPTDEHINELIEGAGGGSGSGVMYVKFNATSNEYSTSMSYDEFMAKFSAGEPPLIYIWHPEETPCLVANMFAYAESEGMFAMSIYDALNDVRYNFAFDSTGFYRMLD